MFYHYMYPDDVVSARHLHDLASDLSKYGWSVTAYPCNRGRRDESRSYIAAENHEDVSYKRVWRPAISQNLAIGRLANTAWMLIAWMRILLFSKDRKPDVILVGTDPIFAVLLAVPVKIFTPSVKVAHWCFDLHPESAMMSGVVKSDGMFIRGLRRLLSSAYGRCDIIADLGVCMRCRLRNYRHKAREVEITPWALTEPERPLPAETNTRHELFGSAKLGILYSGNYGEAHTMNAIVDFARSLRGNKSIHFSFAVRGSRAEELRQQVTAEDTNISFAGFVPVNQLELRLSAADIHLVCLKGEWSGVAVPSKYFGSLAVGRPVIFSGAGDSCISEWVTTKRTGWVLSKETQDSIRHAVVSLAEDASALKSMQTHCHAVYQSDFSRKAMSSKWNGELIALLDQQAEQT